MSDLKVVPTLSAEQKLNIRDVQVRFMSAVVNAQNLNQQLKDLSDKAKEANEGIQTLQKEYQAAVDAVLANVAPADGFGLNLETLEFVESTPEPADPAQGAAPSPDAPTPAPQQ